MNNAAQIKTFRRFRSGETEIATLKIYSDGSALVEDADQNMIIFEEDPKAFEIALEYLQKNGYVECDIE